MRSTMAALAAKLVPLAALVAADAVAVESRVVEDDDSTYHVVSVDLAHETLGVYWLDDTGKPFGSIEALRQDGAAHGRTLAFATNAGIYDKSFRPLGLTIAEGNELRPLNTTHVVGGSGNFGLQPNGVFYVDRAGHAGVVPTSDWTARKIDARIASQSGPMLVIDGAINEGFLQGSESRKWRSGVCAPAPGRVVFVVSERPVSFHAFATVFLDQIGCRDALYLDGTLSQIYTPDGGYVGAPAMMLKPYAAMLGVFAESR